MPMMLKLHLMASRKSAAVWEMIGKKSARRRRAPSANNTLELTAFEQAGYSCIDSTSIGGSDPTSNFVTVVQQD